MRKLGLLLIAVAMTLVFALPAFANGNSDVCPEAGKVEANGGNQDAVNDTVLPAGTQVCIKGGQTKVTVTADGVSTLQELLGTGQDVSHYTVLAPPQTTVTEPPEVTTSTTSTAPPTTTTSAPPSPTTTSSPPPSETPSEEPSPSTSETPPGSPSPSTSESTTPVSPPESSTTRPPGKLAFTGWDSAVPLGALALLLLTAGAYLLRRGSREDRAQRNRGV